MDVFEHYNLNKLMLLFSNWNKLIAVFIGRSNSIKKLLTNFAQKLLV